MINSASDFLEVFAERFVALCVCEVEDVLVMWHKLSFFLHSFQKSFWIKIDVVVAVRFALRKDKRVLVGVNEFATKHVAADA